MTADFIEDAIDSLEKGAVGHILIAANFSSPQCFTSANVPTREHLEWMKRRFSDLCERLEQQYNE